MSEPTAALGQTDRSVDANVPPTTKHSLAFTHGDWDGAGFELPTLQLLAEPLYHCHPTVGPNGPIFGV